jgi:alcohol dehydrogenase YqhD (iron-dependent ADH family)
MTRSFEQGFAKAQNGVELLRNQSDRVAECVLSNIFESGEDLVNSVEDFRASNI